MVHSGKTLVAGIMGWPISHTRSPRLHGYWLREHGIDGAFVPLAVPPEHVAGALRALPWLGFRGVNCTVPHKEAAYATVDHHDAAARRMKAVNTVIVRPDGTLEGRNTDGFGFLENLRQGAPLWRPDAGAAVVLGAGGAARAVVAELLDAGAPEVRVVNRTVARAEAMAADLGGPIRVFPVADRAALDGAALLANTTTLGMHGQPPLAIDLAPLPPAAVVTDAVYVPLLTPLLAQAAARGNRVVDGLGMLLHQGRPGFAAWFGVEPTVTAALRRFVLGEPDHP